MNQVYDVSKDRINEQDIIADVANEVLSILKGEEVRGKQERVEAVLAKMDEREFGNLVAISKEITDFEVDTIKVWN